MIIKPEGREKLFFTGVIKDVNDIHFTFIDKFQNMQTFLIKDILEVEER